MKLAYKIILIVILPVAIASAIIINFVYDSFYNEAENHFQQRLERTTKDYASLIDLKLTTYADYVEYISKDIEIENISRNKMFSQLTRLINYDTIFCGAAIYIDKDSLDKKRAAFYYVKRERDQLDKGVMKESHKDFEEYFAEDKNWLIFPKKTGKGLWTSPYFDKGIWNTNIITYSYPLSINGDFYGILTLNIKLENMLHIIRKNEKRIEGNFNFQVYIVNKRDSMIVYSETRDMIGESVYKYADTLPKNGIYTLDTIFAGKSGSGELFSKTGNYPFYAFFAPATAANWIVVDIIPTREINAYVESTVNKTIIVLILAMITIIIIIYVSSNLITKPISKLSEITVNIAKGDYDHEINLSRKDEIGTLAKNFSKMAQDIKNREEQLKESNVKLDKANKELLVLDKAKNDFLMLLSHEIRTPLNGIIGSTSFLEDMIKDPVLKEFVDMLKESVERLDNFSKTALEITQLKTIGEKIEKEEIEIVELVKSAIEINSDFAQNRNIKISFISAENAKVIVNSESAKKALSNILNNAVKYSFINTTIEINIINKNSKVAVEFINNGVTIDPEKLEKLTDIFELGQAHYDKNTGLGLAYVKAFLDLHDGCLKVDSKAEITNFTICF